MSIFHYSLVCWVLTLVVVSQSHTSLAAVEPAETGANAPTAIHLIYTTGGEVELLFNGKDRTGLKTVAKARKPASFGGVSVSATNAQTLRLQSLRREVTLTSETIPGWSAVIPPSSELKLQIHPQHGWIDFDAGSANQRPIAMRFVDDAEAALSAGASARLDVFSDNSYYLAGRGALTGETGSGEKVRFDPYFPPMSGGPMVAKAGSSKKLVPSTPKLEVMFLGGGQSNIFCLVDGKQHKIEADVPFVLKTKNGTELGLTFNAATLALDWEVKKGMVKFTVAGMECWSALGLSQQQGAQLWAGQSRLIDLKNTTPLAMRGHSSAILVNLSLNINATIPAGATFQYGQVKNCTTFSTSATGGEVALYNVERDVITPLAQGNLLFRAGRPVDQNAAGGPRQAHGFSWSNEGQVELRDTQGLNAVPLHSRGEEIKMMGSSLEVDYTEEGLVRVFAAHGHHVVRPAFLKGLNVDIQEGQAVFFRANRFDGTFTMEGDPDNLMPITLWSGDGLQGQFGADGSVQFRLPKNGGFNTVNEIGAIFWREGSGDSIPDGTQPGMETPNDGAFAADGMGGLLTVDRIDQPALSIFQ